MDHDRKSFNQKLVVRRKTLYLKPAKDVAKHFQEIFQELGLNDKKFRYNAPFIWQRLLEGYCIADLVPHMFSEAMSIVQDYYLPLEPIYEVVGLKNNVRALKVCNKIAIKQLLQMKSLCALRESDGKMVGILLATECKKEDYLETELHLLKECNTDESLQKLITLRNRLLCKLNLFELLDIDKYYQAHALCVIPDFKSANIERSLLNSFVIKAKSLSLTVCCGIFSDGTHQRTALALGFEVKNELDYEESIADDSEQLLSNVQRKKNTIAFTVLELKDPIEETITEVKIEKKPPVPPKVLDKKPPKRTKMIEQRARAVTLI